MEAPLVIPHKVGISGQKTLGPFPRVLWPPTSNLWGITWIFHGYGFLLYSTDLFFLLISGWSFMKGSTVYYCFFSELYSCLPKEHVRNSYQTESHWKQDSTSHCRYLKGHANGTLAVWHPQHNMVNGLDQHFIGAFPETSRQYCGYAAHKNIWPSFSSFFVAVPHFTRVQW